MEIKPLINDRREWLLTNGLGGYASSGVSGINSRRYHGILVAAFSSDDRRVLVPGIEETLIDEAGNAGTTKCCLARGDTQSLLPERFSFYGHPCFEYKVGKSCLKKEVFLPHGMNAVLVKYSATLPISLGASILATSRDHNWVLREPLWDFSFSLQGGIATIVPTHENPPVISIAASDGKISAPGGDALRRGVYYRKEEERGYDFIEDIFVGANVSGHLTPTKPLYLAISSGSSMRESKAICKHLMKAPEEMIRSELNRKNTIVDGFYKNSGLAKDERISRLVSASDDFIITSGKKKAIIAGYPWFGVWGRDSLISLPGLCLATGRYGEAKNIMENLLSVVSQGRVPNTLAGPCYNSADASLWIFWALWKYLKETGDYSFAKSAWPTLKGIISEYKKHCERGLLSLESGRPETWMDAIVDGVPVTLRNGKPVEMQALWFNALMVASSIAKKLGKKDEYMSLAGECKESFNKRFWRDGLLDGIDPEDSSVRPNALLSISMPFPVLDEKRWKAVVKKTEQELLVPYGLRTLSPSDNRYRGRASGDHKSRDLAYHQGDVWPWLLGPFIDAYSRAYPERPLGRFIKALLEKHLDEACIGSISEDFDGDEPHEPEGCISQAWSVAEVLRVLHEHSLLFD
jgi:predicted glycogen debranching enzyme